MERPSLLNIFEGPCWWFQQGGVLIVQGEKRENSLSPLLTTCLCCDTMEPLVRVSGLPNTGTASLGANRNTATGYLLQSWRPARSYLSYCSLCGHAIETIIYIHRNLVHNIMWDLKYSCEFHWTSDLNLDFTLNGEMFKYSLYCRVIAASFNSFSRLYWRQRLLFILILSSIVLTTNATYLI